MNNLKNKIFAALALATILTLALAQVPAVYSAELNAQEKAVSAITDVVGLDLTKYNAQLTRYTSDKPSKIGGPDYSGLSEEAVTYSLESAETKLDVSFKFINKTIVRCDLRTQDGSPLPPLSAQQLPPNILDASKLILKRLQTYTGASYIQDMRNMLDTGTGVKKKETTVGNLKCAIEIVDDYYTALTWIYTSKGVDYPKYVGVYFENGSLLGFGDRWSLYTIGNDNVNISQEEAIRIAKEQAAKNATEVAFSRGENTYEVVKLNLTGPVIATIKGAVREPWTAYPFWHVQLYTEGSTNVNQIQVGIWADTGIIAYCNPVSISGSIGENTPASTLPPTQPSETSTENTATPTSSYIAATAVVATIAIATTAIFIKKRKR